MSINLISCQNTQVIDTKTPLLSSPAHTPPPHWTTATKNRTPNKGAPEFKINTKFVEISYYAEALDLPKKRYQKRLNKKELQTYLIALSQRKGADVKTLPGMIIHEDQAGHIELGEKFLHPLYPSELTKEALGLNYHVRANSTRNSDSLKIDVYAELKELVGQQQVAKGPVNPVIETRRIDSSIKLANGESVVFGGLVTSGKRVLKDKVPFLGDIPIIGRAFWIPKTVTITRELIVIVTPERLPKNRQSSK